MDINPGMYIITSWAIKDGKLQAFESVLAKMIDAVHSQDKGAVLCDYYLSDDQQTSFGVEYYDSPHAYVVACQAVKPWNDELMAAADPTLVWVLGEITDEVRRELEGWTYVHGNFLMGFFDAKGSPFLRMLDKAKARISHRRSVG